MSRILCAALLIACCCGARELCAADRPNILFVLSDDQRFDTIGALGNTEIQTPNLDALAKRGTALSSVYCMGAMQGAVCVPSRAMLMSGRSLFRAPVDLKGVKLLPETLHDAGYATFMTGKWHNGAPSLRGWDSERAVFLGGMSDQRKIALNDRGSGGKLVKRDLTDRFSTELFVDEAVEFLKTTSGEKPFFAYVALTMPHDPRSAPAEYQKLYDPARLKLPASFLPQHPFDNGDLRLRDEVLAPWPRTKEIVQRHTADYYACISYLDAQFGRLVETLEKRGQLANTIIVFTSDHGLALGRHGLFGKQNLYEHSMRPPVIIAGPGIPANEKRDAMCYLFDLHATVCDWAGAKLPEGTEGKSLTPVLEGKSPHLREEIFLAYRNCQRSLRQGDWKVIQYPQVNKTQLFHLSDDPDELHDMAGNINQPERVREMLNALAAAQKRFGDTQPLTTVNPMPLELDLSKPAAKSMAD